MAEDSRPKVPALFPQGEFLGQPPIPLDRTVTTVGSQEGFRFRPQSRSISRAHAILVNTATGAYIADLASRTGISVNGKPTAFSPLNHGDAVRIGKFLFQFRTPRTIAAAIADPPASVLQILGHSPVSIQRRTFLIGRRDNADLPLTHDPAVSTSHAVLFPIDGQWVIRDLVSRTGTFVNGETVHQQKLKIGDAVRIGTITFRLALAELPLDLPDLDFNIGPDTSALAAGRIAEEPAPQQPMQAPMLTELEQPPQERPVIRLELPPPLEPLDAPLPIEPEMLTPADLDLDFGQEPAEVTAEEIQSLAADSQPATEVPILETTSKAEPPASQTPVVDEPPTIEPAPVEIAATANLEILESTDPTPESALELNLEPAPDTTGQAESAPVAALSDTSFGRLIEDFTAVSTGPIVEVPVIAEPALPDIAAPAEPQFMQLESLAADEEFVAIPELEPKDAFPFPSLAEVIPSEPLILEEAPAAEMETNPEPKPQEYSAVVATEIPAPAVDEIPVLEAPEIAAELPAAEVATEEPVAQLSDQSADQPLVEEPMEESAPLPATLEVAAHPAPAEPEAEPTLADAPAESDLLDTSSVTSEPAVSGRGPSIFGFQFEGNAFLGGSSLDLAPVEGPAAQNQTFDVQGGKTSGFAAITQAGGMIANEAVQTPPAAPAPAEPATQVPPAPRASISTLSDDIALPPLATPRYAPPKTRKQHKTDFEGLGKPALGGLVGLGSNVVVGGTMASAVGIGSRMSRDADVFSRITQPISPELFGSRSENPDSIVIPDINAPQPQVKPVEEEVKSNAEMSARLSSTEANPAPPQQAQRAVGTLPGVARQAGGRRVRRGLPVSALLALMVLCLAGATIGTWVLVPQFSKVNGTLSFSNLASQPESLQQRFRNQQLDRIAGEDVRSIARSLLVAQHIPPGFLEDAIQFEQTFKHDGKIEWNGETLSVVCQSSDQSTGKAQVNALLVALAQKDADLADALARAKIGSAQAKNAVDHAAAEVEDLKAQLVAERQRSENRPDPSEITSLEAQLDRQSKLAAVAREARADAQAVLIALSSTSTTRPSDADTDPQLIQLRHQMADLKQQIADLKSTMIEPLASTADNSGDNTPATQPTAANVALLQTLQTQSDAIAAQLNQRQAAIAVDQALTPQQREVNRQKAIEDQSIRMTELKKAEADAQAEADATTSSLQNINGRLEAARLATAHIDVLIEQMRQANLNLQGKTDDAVQREAALAQCITVSGEPQESVQPLPDQRPMVAATASGAVLLIFSLLIISAARSGGAVPRGGAVAASPAV